jgi:peptidyl-tRNA hydrolase
VYRRRRAHLSRGFAQGCHAATAALWLSKDDPTTQSYCSPEMLDSMHKVVLHVKGEAQLLTLAAKLTDAGVVHKLWMEQVGLCTLQGERVDLVGSHGRWKRPCLQTNPDATIAGWACTISPCPRTILLSTD